MSSYLKGLANKINGVENKSFTKELDINSLVPSQNNFYGIREIEELAESINENGLMHNLVVRKKDDGTYEIISGERRYRALKSLGYEKIPCQVKENLSDLDAELMLIQANAEQRELTPSEKMEGIKRLEVIYKQKRNNGEKLQGKTRDLIGKDLGLSGVQVGRYKKVDKDLIPELKEKLDKEEITLTQAHTLSSLTKDEQEIIHEEIKDLNAKESKEEIETLVNGIKQPIESNLDKELLDEMYLNKNANDKEEEKKQSLSEKYLTKVKKNEINIESFESRLDCLKELASGYSKAQLLIDDFQHTVRLNIKEFSINYRTLEFYLEGQPNICKVYFQDSDPNQFRRVNEIYYGKVKIKTSVAFKITFDTYLLFGNDYSEGGYAQ
ncbi:ParB/RepB/Spo0J family partition protein [Clostridium beijerinckii]|uniref:ParB family chromosome partitioning protein n=1 Tax=Clostridium beijerinckii TaxID=1520 RepID=A0AAX0B4N7_CLOBE|nr:ParB N-terminal domain-containing protein [Clostridium beijerinckii]NRT90121.1 ParB family chromosome partitioning protein [Clostridium beijerinckii]NYC69651.1 ParB family chromosome partitioning protein [Clostridium beijerinckii]